MSTGSIKSMYHFALQASHYDTDFPISPFAGPFPGCLQPLAGILPAVFPGVARYACKKTTTNLPGQLAEISSGYNDLFGLKKSMFLFAKKKKQYLCTIKKTNAGRCLPNRDKRIYK